YLGMNLDQYLHLSSKIGLILHLGARVDHFAPYSELRKENSIATKEIVLFAAQEGRKKQISLISTYTQKGRGPRLEAESSGYELSKAVSERMLDSAGSLIGFDVQIIRLGQVFAEDFESFELSNNMLLTIILLSVRIRSFPMLEMNV